MHLDPESPWSSLRGLEPVSFCDWPGRISSVLFLGGCNLRCPTCHNRTIAWKPESLPPIPRQDVVRLVKARHGWIDGLVITGGEPTTVPALEELLTDLAALGLPLKLDTNGLEPKLVAGLLTAGLVECFAVDVKGPWRKYPELSGGACSPEWAEESLGRIFALASEHPSRFIFRLTEVPALTSEDIDEAEASLPEDFTLQRQEYRPVREDQNTRQPDSLSAEAEAAAQKG